MVIVYDNVNFKDTKRDEVVGHRATMQAMTTAALILCPELPLDGLRQSMHNPAVPLKLHDIFNSPGISGDEIGPDITRSLISDAIRRVHRTGVNHIFQNSNQSPPQIPILKILPSNKT